MQNMFRERHRRDDTSWNSEIDYDEKLVWKDRDFWNVEMYFDGGDGRAYSLTPQQVFCEFKSAKDALDALRIITCEMTDQFNDQYLVELRILPSYTGIQFAYSLGDIDGEFNYSWDDEDANAISSRIYNVATKALSNYFKKVKKWASIVSFNPELQKLGTFRILSFHLSCFKDGSTSILFDCSPEEAVQKAIDMYSIVYLDGEMYFLYYRWDESPRIEARYEDGIDLVYFPSLEKVVKILKDEVFSLLLKKKVSLLPD